MALLPMAKNAFHAQPISEKDLIAPAVMIMARDEFLHDGITIKDLSPKLRDALQPSGHDLQTIPNRKDDVFSQKVRNLVSHRTLVKLGLADYRMRFGRGRYLITEKGKAFAKAYSEKRGVNLSDMTPEQLILPYAELLRELEQIWDHNDE